MACPKVFCKLLVLVMVGLTVSQETQEERIFKERTVQEVVTCANIPSLTLTYVTTNRLHRFVKGYGSYVKNGQPKTVETKSVFCIGGATQAFTSVLLAKLLDENKNFTWETPIKYIVGHRLALPTDFIASNINLKDILAMRTGFAGMDIVPVAKPYSREQLVSNLRFSPRVAGFRDKFVYNEVFFSLLEEVFQVLGGDTWRNLMKTHILGPLDMKQTYFIGDGSSSNPEFVNGAVFYGSNPYQMGDEVYSGLELVESAASLCTTAEDMSRWLQFLLSDGQKDGNVIVRKEALEETYEAVQSRGRSDPLQQSYEQSDILSTYVRKHNSLGWINGNYQGIPFISQEGSLPGYQALVTVIPSLKFGFYVAYTGDLEEKRSATKVMLSILGIDLFLKRSPWTGSHVCSVLGNLTKNAMKNRKDDRHASKKQPYELKEYTGSFRNYAYGGIQVTYNESQDDSLIMEYGMAMYKLDHVSNNTFQMNSKSGPLWYSTNADWYRDKQRLLAEFHVDNSEEKNTTVSIRGFDKHHNPEFSTNPQPPTYDHDTDYYRCSAPAIVACQFFIMLFSALVYFR